MGVEFVKCIRNNSGRLSTPFLYCRAGVVFKSFSLQTRHLLSPTAAIHQFFVFTCHSSSSSSRRHGHHDIIGPSRPPKISIFSRVRPLSTSYRNSLQKSAADRFVLTQHLRAVYMVCWKWMVSYISPHAFLVGPVQGGQGIRLHASHSQRHSFLTRHHVLTACGMCWFFIRRWLPMAPAGQLATTVKTSPDIFERSLQRLFTVFKIHHTSNLLGSHSCLFSRDHGCWSRLALVSPSKCLREESSQSPPMAQDQYIMVLKGDFLPIKKVALGKRAIITRA